MEHEKGEETENSPDKSQKSLIEKFYDDLKLGFHKVDTTPFLMVYPSCVQDDMRIIFNIGKTLFRQYVENRIVNGTENVIYTGCS